MNRRSVLTFLGIVAASPAVPLLTNALRDPGALVFSDEQIARHPNGIGYLYRSLAHQDGMCAMVAMAALVDPRLHPEVMQLVRDEAKDKLREYFDNKRRTIDV